MCHIGLQHVFKVRTSNAVNFSNSTVDWYFHIVQVSHFSILQLVIVVAKISFYQKCSIITSTVLTKSFIGSQLNAMLQLQIAPCKAHYSFQTCMDN